MTIARINDIMIACKGVEKISERNLAIRVDDEFFKKVKIRLAEKNMTLKDYFIDLAERDIQSGKLDEFTSCSREELIKKADQVIQLMQEIKESQK